ncbi:nuclear condensing complex subunit [Fennellomyces sp. T-0311]|nr:nuclear condensing complex subunit [Fennellomyces sp. T-0311]
MSAAASRKETAIASLSSSVPQIFNDAQKPNANHRKHAIALRKIQEQCALLSPIVAGEPHQVDLDGEDAFNKAVIRNINKILQIRKGEPNADRITRFISTFLQYTQQIDTKSVNGDEEEDEETDEHETISARFIENMLKHLLRGLPAKTKAVRLRCCQIIALSINSLGEIDEELYQQLRAALFERIRDKEASIRIQAATALARLQSADDEVDEEDGKTITKKLLWLLQHDPSAEVRRVVLFNLDVTDETMPFIIERSRDIDAVNRRVVFLKPMVEIGDFRDLSATQRHDLLKSGLKDRDPLVRRAVSKMVANEWIRHAGNNLLEFLERMDVVSDASVAEDMLYAFLDTRADIVKSIKLDDQFWENLSTESALMAKVLIKFLKNSQNDEKLDEVLPTVTRLAFIIQHYNEIWQQAPKETEADYEYIMNQLLDIAKYLDYGDEVGRRKMFVLLREILMAPDMPDDHMVSAVELFKLITLDERDFVRTIIEIISDIQELTTMDEDMAMEGPAKRLKLSEITSIKTENGEVDPTLLQKMLLQLKCLSICKYMLERTEESLQDNSTLYGVLNELIVPSVQSKEAVLREEGLHCLGLCCTLDKTLGHHNILLFAHCINNGHEQLQQKALMILFDLMMTYGVSTVESKLEGLDELRKILEYCVDHDSPAIQSTAVEGLSKLMLTRLFRDEETLKMMVLLYFFPTAYDNEKIQQCLSYFFPAYCYSSSENQQLLAKIAVPALLNLCDTYTDLEKDEKMASPSRISDMIADWTDPRKIEVSRIVTTEERQVDTGIQADVAYDILKAIYHHTGLVRKTMVHMLLKVYIAEADQTRLEKLKSMVDLIIEEKPIKEAAVRNSFNRFVKTLEKCYESVEKEEEEDQTRATDNEDAKATDNEDDAATKATMTDNEDDTGTKATDDERRGSSVEADASMKESDTEDVRSITE